MLSFEDQIDIDTYKEAESLYKMKKKDLVEIAQRYSRVDMSHLINEDKYTIVAHIMGSRHNRWDERYRRGKALVKKIKNEIEFQKQMSKNFGYGYF